jgi:hypothetical protein
LSPPYITLTTPKISRLRQSTIMFQLPMVPSIAPPEDFARLPNELVLDIAKHLGNARDGASSQALSRLGSLNHAYHQYSEEFLYEHCDVTAFPMTPFHLLRTFFRRPDLDARVKSMVISPLYVFGPDRWRGHRRKKVGFVPWTTACVLIPFLQELTSQVLDLIEKTQLPPVAKQRWRDSVKTYQPTAWYGALLALTPDFDGIDPGHLAQAK